MLAGFPDDLADEGPAAGPASLVGLEHRPRARLDRAATPTPRAGSDAAADTKEEAVEQADTSRAETETKQEEGK